MKSVIQIPENLTEFLHWIKETTESFWDKTPEIGVMRGAKWLGLSETEIDEIEIKYSIKFSDEHREFLRILHTIEVDGEATVEEHSIFYNWLDNENKIGEMLCLYITAMLGQSKRRILGQSFRESLGHFPCTIIRV